MQDTVRVRYGLHRQRLATLAARLEQHAVPFWTIVGFNFSSTNAAQVG